MRMREREGIEGKTFVVTGGLGYVGWALCLALVRRGAACVRAFDIRSRSAFSHDLHTGGVLLMQGDIGVKGDVERAVRGADCVFHVASFGMSGKEMLQMGRVDRVNIDGTCHVLEACRKLGVGRVVYVSTYNVVFGGAPILKGDERLGYLPMESHIDPYSRSKAVAEQLVLAANSGDGLRTCAIRPAAIYGPREERHLPRIVSMAKLGLIPFTIGDSSVKTDWIYIDNLVLALIRASMALLPPNPIAAGQAYFVSDGSPVNSFEFIRPLLKSLDYDLPAASISVPHALRIAKVFSAVYAALYPWLDRRWLPQPFILPTEVYKVGVSHHFSLVKARQELGYIPIVSPQEGMGATISYWQHMKRKAVDGPTIYAWLFVLLGMTALFSAAYLPDIGPVPFLRATSLLLFRSIWMVKMAFLLASMLHLSEALYAWSLANRVDPLNATPWFWQTFALGFFSLRFLLKRANT